MRFEVPQFIDIEDKIFGPLSWRQFLYVGGGVGMAAVMFFTLPFIVAVIFGLPLALLAGALAFFPVNNRPFSFFLESILNYFTRQRMYLWRQKNEVVYTNDTTVIKKNSYIDGAVAPTVKKQHKDLTALARDLELQALQKNE